jgi:hypothetical protein
MNYEEKIKLLEEELKKTKEELLETKEHLKKYTAPPKSKIYYNKHKDFILEKRKDPEYKEKRKEYNKKSYLNKKEKLKTENINIEQNKFIEEET